MAGTFFFCVGEGGGGTPPFYRIINNFLLFYHGQLIRTYIKNTILESSSKRRLVRTCLFTYVVGWIETFNFLISTSTF